MPKYDPVPIGPWYVFAQFWVGVIATLALLGAQDVFQRTEVLFLAGVLLVSFYSQGAMLEGRRYSLWVEWLRLTGIAARQGALCDILISAACCQTKDKGEQVADPEGGGVGNIEIEIEDTELVSGKTCVNYLTKSSG